MGQQQTLFGIDELKKMTKKKSKKAEENVQIEVCNYLRAKYPDVIFQCDLASGMKLPIHIAARHKKMRSSRGMPDLFIAKQKSYFGGFTRIESGLFIELKRSGVKIFKKDGELVADEHIREQAAILERLRSNGYKAEFACGFEEAVKIIDEYLGG